MRYKWRVLRVQCQVVNTKEYINKLPCSGPGYQTTQLKCTVNNYAQ